MGILMKVLRMFRRRHYLLMDGMHSCAYIPKRTYSMMMRRLVAELDRNPKAENSLRFVWAFDRQTGVYRLAVNPMGVELARTCGLARDNKGRILIPCPYLQQIYGMYGVEPERCGRMYLEEDASHYTLMCFKILKD